MADTVGKRPTPSIPTSKSTGKGTTDSTGGTESPRSVHNKSPEGNRPTPTIPAQQHPPAATVPGGTKAPIKHTSMSSPNRERLSNAPKSEGGGTY